MNQLQKAMLFRDAGAVKRYHTCRMARQQDLAAHTHGVAMLVLQVFPECSKNLLVATLHHDLPELVTGDIPAPTKRGSVVLTLELERMEQGTAPLYVDMGLSPFEECVLKWCDTFELVLFCMEDLLMGNVYATAPLRKGLHWCRHEHAGKTLLATTYSSAVVSRLLAEVEDTVKPYLNEESL